MFLMLFWIDFLSIFDANLAPFWLPKPTKIVSWRRLEGVLGCLEGVLGASRGILGTSWGRLGGVLGRLGGVLGPSWGVLRASWVRLGASWVRLGPSAGRLGASWRRFVRHAILDAIFQSILDGLCIRKSIPEF